MRHFFVPFAGNQPAFTVINGHRLVVVAQDKNDLLEHLEFFGGDRVEQLLVDELSGNVEDGEKLLLEELAESVGGGVVVAPHDVDLIDVVRNLETELPWIQ